jgi:hypothetical protein
MRVAGLFRIACLQSNTGVEGHADAECGAVNSCAALVIQREVGCGPFPDGWLTEESAGNIYGITGNGGSAVLHRNRTEASIHVQPLRVQETGFPPSQRFALTGRDFPGVLLFLHRTLTAWIHNRSSRSTSG